MIKTRIASTAALFTFGLAALGGTVVAIAAPANADPGTTSPSATSVQDNAQSGNKFEPEKHALFPDTPQSPHEDHGHKGMNEAYPDPAGPTRPVFEAQGLPRPDSDDLNPVIAPKARPHDDGQGGEEEIHRQEEIQSQEEILRQQDESSAKNTSR